MLANDSGQARAEHLARSMPDEGASGSGLTRDGSHGWLSKHRVKVPGRVTGYLERSALTERCMPTGQPMTLLHAPGGFGKTTVLAECCRTLADQGVPVAWLSLDGKDEPATLGAYLAFSLQRAGVDVPQDLLQANDAAALHPHDRVASLLRLITVYGEPCVLVLDELERVRNPDSMTLLNVLIRSRPATLHLAMACRELPVGIDVSVPVFGGDAGVVTASDLRFSRAEIDRFFDGQLSRRELAALAADSAGWPIALRVRPKVGEDTAERVGRDVVANWMKACLWRDLTPADHEFLLDVGLFDWMDEELLDEVLDGIGSLDRLDGMSGVAGLLEPARGGARRVLRLHPLIREHCAERRRRETPERFRLLHRRIAAALARRSDVLPALRHAATAQDARLAGRILMDAGGGMRLWLREGPECLLTADRLISDEAVDMYPRLALVRVLAQILNGRIAECRPLIDAIAVERSHSGPDHDLEGDLCVARGMLAQASCESVGSAATPLLVAETERVTGLAGIEPVVRAAAEWGLCQIHNLKAEFDAALDRGERARRSVGNRSHHLTLALDLQLGQIAMAQGRVQAAVDRYGIALRQAKRSFPQDQRLTLMGEVLTLELELERNRVADARGALRAVTGGGRCRGGVDFACSAAASAAVAELTHRVRGARDALSMLDEMLDNANMDDLPALARYLEGVRSGLLVATGRVGEAERSWRVVGLPMSDAGCLDLGKQSWREMEVLSCTRLRLAIARREFDSAREFADQLLRLVSARELRRTWMRALALAIRLEETAGDRGAALAHLREFVILFAETDYAGVLAREREVAAPLLQAFIDAGQESALDEAALALLDAVGLNEECRLATLSLREQQILDRLEGTRDRDIASALGLTANGVRYHLQHLFAKLEVRDRHAAVHRGRLLGLLRPSSSGTAAGSRAAARP